ncbi:MAG: SH3 domain-containing protein [Anaerolineae bacterium]
MDGDGLLVAEAVGGHVDGVTFVLDGGSYEFTVLGSNLSREVVAGVRVVSAEDGGFMVLEAPAMPAETAVAPTALNDCRAVVTASSVNLRSGPGTAYSVLGYAYRGESYPVGGRNRENSWVVIGTSDSSSAWVALSVAQLQGSCAALTVFDIPTRDAAQAQLFIISPGRGYDDDRYDDDDHDDHKKDKKKDKKDKHDDHKKDKKDKHDDDDHDDD